MSKTYKNTFGKKSIKMDSLDVENKEYILRYCASEKSIPKAAININLIYGKTWELGQQELFNNYTNLPFGYSYKIEKKYNELSKNLINEINELCNELNKHFLGINENSDNNNDLNYEGTNIEDLLNQ